MDFLTSLQDSAFGMWIAGAETIWAYPTILTLHTIGLGVVVGANAVIDLRLLGVGRGMPLAELQRIYRPMWIGFVVNLLSGIGLFIATATKFGFMVDFYIKLTLIALALVIAVRIRRLLFGRGVVSDSAIPQQARILAAVSLVLWSGAVISGRLMAYIN